MAFGSTEDSGDDDLEVMFIDKDEFANEVRRKQDRGSKGLGNHNQSKKPKLVL